MCRGHSHIRMYYKKKHLFLYSLVLLFFFFFWHFLSRLLLVLLSSSFVDIRTTMFFCLFHAFLHCLVLVVMGGEREREIERTMRRLYNDAKCLCVCARARVDRLYFLSIYENDENAENACFTVTSLLRIESFSFSFSYVDNRELLFRSAS
jgi:hypothetical protein